MQSVLWPDFSLRRHPYVTSGQEQLSTWRHEWRKVVALWCGAYHTRCVVVAQIQFSNCKVWHEAKKCISLHLKQCASATSWRATEVKLSLLLLWSTLPQCLQIYLQRAMISIACKYNYQKLLSFTSFFLLLGDQKYTTSLLAQPAKNRGS